MVAIFDGGFWGGELACVLKDLMVQLGQNDPFLKSHENEITFGGQNMDSSVTISEVKNRLSEIANQVAYGKDRIIVTRKGKNLMALVPIEDIEAIEQLEDRFDLEEARRVLSEEQESVPWEEVKKKLNL